MQRFSGLNRRYAKYVFFNEKNKLFIFACRRRRRRRRRLRLARRGVVRVENNLHCRWPWPIDLANIASLQSL
jgi:hypothetical protein